MEKRRTLCPCLSPSGRPLRRLGVTALVLGLGCLGAAPRGLAGPSERDPESRREPLAELPYREIMDHVVVVPVHLDGLGPFDLVLDTGATFTTLDPALAIELGLERLDDISIVTIAGARRARRGRLESVQLGPVVVSGVDVVWSEVGFLGSADPSVRGILGQSALSRVSFGLDHHRRRILFEPPERPDEVLPLVHREGRPAVTLHPRRAQGELSLVLDTGAPAPVLFQKPGTRLPVTPRPGGYFEARTLSGRARLPMVLLEGRLGRLGLPSTLAAVQADAAAGGREEDGLLPTRLFRIVYFDRVGERLLLRR